MRWDVLRDINKPDENERTYTSKAVEASDPSKALIAKPARARKIVRRVTFMIATGNS